MRLQYTRMLLQISIKRHSQAYELIQSYLALHVAAKSAELSGISTFISLHAAGQRCLYRQSRFGIKLFQHQLCYLEEAASPLCDSVSSSEKIKMFPSHNIVDGKYLRETINNEWKLVVLSFTSNHFKSSCMSAIPQVSSLWVFLKEFIVTDWEFKGIHSMISEINVSFKS